MSTSTKSNRKHDDDNDTLSYIQSEKEDLQESLDKIESELTQMDFQGLPYFINYIEFENYKVMKRQLKEDYPEHYLSILYHLLLGNTICIEK